MLKIICIGNYVLFFLEEKFGFSFFSSVEGRMYFGLRIKKQVLEV